MPTIELEEVLELQSERVAKVGTNAEVLLGHRYKRKNDLRIDLQLAELREITSMAFALATRTAKKESELPELEKMWSKVAEICDLATILANKLIPKARTPVSIADFERFQEAARFRAHLYSKPA